MGDILDAANTTYADGPSGNPKNPGKEEIRPLFKVIDDAVEDLESRLTSTKNDIAKLSDANDALQSSLASTQSDITDLQSLLTTSVQWKEAVVAATAEAGTLSTDYADGSEVDGVTLATGNRILIKDQSSKSENGVYIVAASGAPTRATDADTGTEIAGMAVFVAGGDINSGTAWICTATGTITVDTTDLPFVQISSGSAEIYVESGTDVPNPASYSIGKIVTIEDGDHAIQCVRSPSGYWLPLQAWRPSWMPTTLDSYAHFKRKRLWRDGLGYKPLLSALTITRASERWARSSAGYVKFAANVPAITDLGISTWDGNINLVYCSRDLTITHRIVAASGKTFTDGETVTSSTGTGTGTYVDDQSDSSGVYAVRGGSGTWTGNLVGGTSSESAAISSSGTVWVATNMTVALSEDGADADATENRGTLLTASAANATLLQTLIGVANSRFVIGAVIKRVTGTGKVYMTMDGGTTWVEVTLTSSYQMTAIPAQLVTGAPSVGFKIETSGDAIAVDFFMAETGPTDFVGSAKGYLLSDPIVSTCVRGVTADDVLTGAIGIFGSALTSNTRTFIASSTPYNNTDTGGYFASLDQGTDGDRLTLDYANKDTFPTSNIKIGVTLAVDNGTPIGADPQTELLQIGERNLVGYTLDRDNTILISALNGDTQDFAEWLGATFTKDDIPDQTANTDFYIGYRRSVRPLNGYIEWIAAGAQVVSETALGDLVTIDGDLDAGM